MASGELVRVSMPLAVVGVSCELEGSGVVRVFRGRNLDRGAFLGSRKVLRG